MARQRKSDGKLEVLREVPLFSACSERELKRISRLADRLDVREGQVLTRQGETGRECFVIVEGKAKVGIRGRKGATLGPGECVGEMALLDGGPRTATVTALTDVQVLVLTRRSFSSLVDEVPSVARKIMQTLAGRLRAAERSPQH